MPLAHRQSFAAVKMLFGTLAFALCLAPAFARAGVHGVCLGNDHPAANCKTCETCFYCGRKGRWGNRPENSGTCAVCEKARAAEVAEKKGSKP